MPRIDLIVESTVEKTARVMQMSGIFDVVPEETQSVEWHLDFPIEDRDWNVGMIVGPSGSGKTRVAQHVFGDSLVHGFEWDKRKALLDDFPASVSVSDVTKTLTAVGFASPPSWIRPFQVLSTGQQFRVELARALMERPDPVVVDEFTSTVDRTVAQVGSAAVAKMVRNRKQKFVGVTCHYDVIDWLQPCWLLDMSSGNFQWRSVQRHPAISLEVYPCDSRSWSVFAEHHYLSAELNRSARCFVALINGQPAAFVAVLSHPHAKRPGFRASRTVVMPDFQGVGIGNYMSDLIAAAYIAGKHKPYFSVTSHPALISSRNHSSNWRVTRKLTIGRPSHGKSSTVGHAWKLDFRATASFEFVGKPNHDAAKALGIVPTRSKSINRNALKTALRAA